MRVFLILLALAIAGLAVYFGLPAAGYPIRPWVLVALATLSGLYAGGLVLIGENIIEDCIKSAIILALTGITWYSYPKAGFLFICALVASVTGTVLNQVARAIEEKQEARTGKQPAGPGHDTPLSNP